MKNLNLGQSMKERIATLQSDAQAGLESARQKAKELKDNAQGFLHKDADLEGGQSEAESTGDESVTEKDRLVSDGVAGLPPSVRAGIAGLGSRLGQSLETVKSIGTKGVNDLRSATNQSLDSAKSLSAKGVSDIRSATCQQLETAKALGAKGVSDLRSASSTAVAASSSACRSSVDIVRSTTAAAKGQCEAISAVAALSGVSLGTKKEPQGLCPALSYRQRVIGCVSCLLLGTLLSLFSLGSLAQLVLGNPAPFAIKYTIGNLLSLGASSFLVGPRRQCLDMLAPSRRIASLTYMAMMVGTLLSVFVFKMALLSLGFIILQFVALTWYVLSYIPYGQAAAKRLLRRLLKSTGLPLGAGTDRKVSPTSAAELGAAGE